MAAKGDVDMADATAKTQDPNDYADLLQTNHSDAFAFSDTEELALQLYDQLKELELQQSLLQAQQSGTSRTWRILPLVTENDAVSMIHGSLTSKLASTNKSLSVAEQNNIVANQKNRELAQTMLALAEEMKAQSVQDIEDPQLRQRVDAVDKELKDSRRRVRTLKGILSAMIVGSGINWAADEGLTELVMEDEDD
ncbi:hypothetical protein J4E85_005859 [Alternaria conjuncta]|uniref:uncharacterized protein n=1 Tax=Alternaria conjuncta TaxID=181017 RepID=UPI00221F442F|nr:uncharacterized protein J4E85_005859 [Alternaria conjuncta]KAI4927349.1 hypothetical protein J4E85_005859 [Alternaria conjuncta]